MQLVLFKHLTEFSGKTIWVWRFLFQELFDYEFRFPSRRRSVWRPVSCRVRNGSSRGSGSGTRVVACAHVGLVRHVSSLSAGSLRGLRWCRALAGGVDLCLLLFLEVCQCRWWGREPAPCFADFSLVLWFPVSLISALFPDFWFLLSWAGVSSCGGSLGNGPETSFVGLCCCKLPGQDCFSCPTGFSVSYFYLVPCIF